MIESTIGGDTAFKEVSTVYVKSLSQPIVDVGLERVSLDWDSPLDTLALHQNVPESRRKLLYLKVKTGDQEVSSMLVNRDLGVCHLKSDVETFVTELAGMTLTLDRMARSYEVKRIVKTIENIAMPLDNGGAVRLPLRDLINIDRTNNDSTAVFDLWQPASEDSPRKPIALDLSERYPPMQPSETPTIITSGSFPGLSQTLEPERLVSLTLRLDHLREGHVDDLVQILSSSKNTFKQLALVGRPKDGEADEADKPATKLLNVLETLKKRSRVFKW
ncbi:hypothetical protein BGW39_008678 [Mortierella sp. 14UC]|nr:hypothetical protein BGW39_008678 [Mortierella sp. 14UC]